MSGISSLLRRSSGGGGGGTNPASPPSSSASFSASSSMSSMSSLSSSRGNIAAIVNRVPAPPSEWNDARIRQDTELSNRYKKRTGPYGHVTVYIFKGKDDKQKEGWVCNHCQLPSVGINVPRMEAHLSGQPGGGIQPCDKVRMMFFLRVLPSFLLCLACCLSCLLLQWSSFFVGCFFFFFSISSFHHYHASSKSSFSCFRSFFAYIIGTARGLQRVQRKAGKEEVQGGR